MCLDRDIERAGAEFERLDGMYGFERRHELWALWARQALEVKRAMGHLK